MKLWLKIFLGLFAGFLFGLIFKDTAGLIKPVGDIFINLIKMLVVPLVFSSLVVGVTSMSDTRKMGRVGLKIATLYLTTTALAIIFGLALGILIQPGEMLQLADPQTVTAISPSKDRSITEILVDLVPQNPFRALSEGNILQLIFFSILLGISLNLAGEKGKPVVKFFESLSEAIFKLTGMIMELAPYGVFALIAHVSSRYGWEVLLPLFKVVVGVYLACLLHTLVTLGGLIKFVGKLNPIVFFKGIFDAWMVAYSTASSSVTLPVSIGCVRKNLGVSDNISSFALPLGATINMDGTAVYQGVVALFVAQAYGIDLSSSDYLTIIVTATLASIGTAGVPGAGLIMLTMVLSSVGLPIEGVALIAGIDRVLDMARTSVNVVGDCMVSVLVAKSENELDVKTYYRGAEDQAG